MDPEQVMGTALRLTASVEALAALAAYIRIQNEGIDVDPAVRDVLDRVVEQVVGSDGHVPDAVGGAVVGMARAFLRQAADLVDAPARRGEWSHTDEALLQGLGRLSMSITQAVGAAESSLAGLGERLRQPGATILDVGTGTGWLAIALARAYPDARVVGLDVYEPSLALARRNVTAEGLDGRVTVQAGDVAELDERAAYDMVWLPLPFIGADVVKVAAARAASALRPGGWLLPGAFAGPDDPLSRLLIELRTLRSGGHPWKPDELIGVLAGSGLADATEVPRTWAAPVQLFAARRD